MNQGNASLKEKITLNEVLEILFNRTGNFQEPFCLTAISADKARNTGGKILRLTNMIVPTTERLEKMGIETASNANRTSFPKKCGIINLINIDSRRPAKVHIELMIEFNGKQII